MITETLYEKFAPYAEHAAQKYNPFESDVFEYITTHAYFLAIDETTPDNRVKAMVNILCKSWTATRRHIANDYRNDKDEDFINGEFCTIENARDLAAMTPEEYAIEHESNDLIKELFQRANLTPLEVIAITPRLDGNILLKDIAKLENETEERITAANSRARKKLKPFMLEMAQAEGYNTTSKAYTRPKIGNMSRTGKRLPDAYFPTKDK